ENVAAAPLMSVPMLQVTVPVPPPGGVEHVNAGPAVCDSDTNVALAGTASLSATVSASDGPLLVTLIVYVILDPPATEGGDPLFVTATSATVEEIVADDDAELLAVFESAVVLLTAAVFVIVEPVAALLPACTAIVKFALAPAASRVKEHVTVPVPPTDGFVQAAVGPEFCVSERNVVPAGTASVIVTFCASLAPLFVTM